MSYVPTGNTNEIEKFWSFKRRNMSQLSKKKIYNVEKTRSIKMKKASIETKTYQYNRTRN